MENKKIQVMFSNAIIKEGFDKYMSDEYRKHMSDDDLNQIHIKVYDYYLTGFSKENIVFNDIIHKNLNTLLEHFIETEDYEKCAFIRDSLDCFVHSKV